ncbi:unnamed protein product, partial [Prorocentrum cordatum]
MKVLCVALNQYQGRRIVAMHDSAVDVGHPRCGLAAGCGFATFAVQVYTLEPLDNWSASNKQLAFSIFIDDLLQGITRPTLGEVVSHLVKGVADLHVVIRTELKYTIAVAKSATIANHAGLKARLAKAPGRHA